MSETMSYRHRRDFLSFASVFIALKDIMKTRLFKYTRIKNFTSENWIISDQKL